MPQGFEISPCRMWALHLPKRVIIIASCWPNVGSLYFLCSKWNQSKSFLVTTDFRGHNHAKGKGVTCLTSNKALQSVGSMVAHTDLSRPKCGGPQTRPSASLLNWGHVTFYRYPHFLKVHGRPLHFYEKPTLVLVFPNWKKSKEDFCFNEKR